MAKLFPVLDIFRLVILHPEANVHYTVQDTSDLFLDCSMTYCHFKEKTIVNLLKKYVKLKQTAEGELIPIAVKLMAIRLAANCFSTVEGAKYMLLPQHIEQITDCIAEGLETEDSKMRLVSLSLSVAIRSLNSLQGVFNSDVQCQSVSFQDR